jgi:hypothetical protein
MGKLETGNWKLVSPIWAFADILLRDSSKSGKMTGAF